MALPYVAGKLTTMVEPAAPVGRVMRRPRHPFQVRTRPYQIQPFFIAAVLPGETMKNLLLQARVVSDPVKNPLIGWWQEYYFFYCKHRDLNVRDHLTAMMLDASYDLSSIKSTTANAATYFHAGASDARIDWVQLCLDRVVEMWFRSEDETTLPTLDGLPMAKAVTPDDNWMDSLSLGAELPVAEPTTIDDVELSPQQRMFEYMRGLGVVDMTYEEWLRTHGVSVPKEEGLNRPELIRYVRDWTYPANTINPADGAPSSALSWSIAERADKDRFFREPGFLLGVSVTRPKIYLSGQKGTATSLLDDAFGWLPALMKDHLETSLKLVSQGKGPLPGLSDVDGYWMDLRDLFLYGEQFCNFDLAATDAGLVALPTAAGERQFVASADIDALFKTGTANKVKQDGVVSLAILGGQRDHT